MKHARLILAIAFMNVAAAGCVAPDDEVSSSLQKDGPLEVVAPEDRYRAAEEVTGYLDGQVCTATRNDHSSSITVGSGYWGEWASCWDFCPAGSYAYDVWVFSEQSLGSGEDDTAANTVELGCYNTSGMYKGNIASRYGYWGLWGSQPSSNSWSNPIVGGKMRIEAQQGSGDDTAANGFVAKLKSGSTLSPTSQTSWGAWTPYATCPSGQAVCGMKVRFETQQGGGDDTTLNGIKFACCPF